MKLYIFLNYIYFDLDFFFGNNIYLNLIKYNFKKYIIIFFIIYILFDLYIGTIL